MLFADEWPAYDRGLAYACAKLLLSALCEVRETDDLSYVTTHPAIPQEYAMTNPRFTEQPVAGVVINMTATNTLYGGPSSPYTLRRYIGPSLHLLEIELVGPEEKPLFVINMTRPSFKGREKSPAVVEQNLKRMLEAIYDIRCGIASKVTKEQPQDILDQAVKVVRDTPNSVMLLGREMDHSPQDNLMHFTLLGLPGISCQFIMMLPMSKSWEAVAEVMIRMLVASYVIDQPVSFVDDRAKSIQHQLVDA